MNPQDDQTPQEEVIEEVTPSTPVDDGAADAQATDVSTTDDSTDDSTDTAQTDTAAATDLSRDFVTLDNLIKGYIRDLQKLKDDLRQQQQMFKDAVENDVNFKTHNDKAKEVTRAKNGAKLALLKQPALVELKAKVDDLRDEIKSTQEGLTEYLVEYLKVAKTNQIITDNGEIHEIVNTPKLIKKSAKYNP